MVVLEFCSYEWMCTREENDDNESIQNSNVRTQNGIYEKTPRIFRLVKCLLPFFITSKEDYGHALFK